MPLRFCETMKIGQIECTKSTLSVILSPGFSCFAGVADVLGKGRRALGHPGNLGAAALVFRLVPIEGRSRRRHQSLTCRFRAPVRCSAESMLSRRRCIRRALRASSCHPIGSWNAPPGPSKPRLPAPPLGVPLFLPPRSWPQSSNSFALPPSSSIKPRRSSNAE